MHIRCRGFKKNAIYKHKHVAVVINSRNLTKVHTRCRGFKKNAYFFHLAGSAVGHSLKNLMQKLVLLSFPYAHTHTQTESREEFYIPTGLQQTEFETGKHVMLSTRV